MGVKGLTKYIAQNAEQYLRPYELHDCNLVIDGNNLAAKLYVDNAGHNSAFGGDYDWYYRSVVNFFHVLSQCNITPFIIMDGSVEKKKLANSKNRLRAKIACIKHISPNSSRNVLPVMLLPVFMDALHDCMVPVTRCLFEADDEIATLSRKLNCPVLSGDSDFYIYDVSYIPMSTLSLKAYQKQKSATLEKEQKLTKSAARHLEKRIKRENVFQVTEVYDDAKCISENKSRRKQRYRYLDCCIYRIKHLTERRSLDKEMLPLFAIMLGNDYVKRPVIGAFLQQMKLKGRGRSIKRQENYIRRVLQWLKTETYDSALGKILGALKQERRKNVLERLNSAMEGYKSETCLSYEFFSANYKELIDQCSQKDSDYKSELNENTSEDDEEHEHEGEEEDETEDDDEEEGEDEEEEEEEDGEKAEGKEANKEGEEQECEQETSAESTEEEDDENEEQIKCNDGEQEENEDSEEEQDIDHSSINSFPSWFREGIISNRIERQIATLAHLNLILGTPQIEHFLFEDCNKIAIPIARHIFTLLYNIEGTEEDQTFLHPRQHASRSNSSNASYFRYIGRVTKLTNVITVKYEVEQPPIVPFNPYSPDPRLFQSIFNRFSLDSSKLFTSIEKIPTDLRLYILSIIYWIQTSKHVDLIHLRSVLICLVVLRTVDSKIEPIRDINNFNKCFGSFIKKVMFSRLKQQATDTPPKLNPKLESLSPPERMQFISKADCVLVQQNLLKHFQMQEIYKRRYDHYCTIILHAFAELQSVVYYMHGLNGLLNNIYEPPRMGQFYCGVFIFNMYDLLKPRLDMKYYIQHHIFKDSPLMFDFYKFLWDWCWDFIPCSLKNTAPKAKQRVKRSKKPKTEGTANTTACITEDVPDEDFLIDLNNKFSLLLIQQ